MSGRGADIFAKRSGRLAAYGPLAAAGVRPYYRAATPSAHAGETVVDGRRLVMAGCNDYLGLASDPRVRAAAADAVRRYGTSCSGSRAFNGTLALHEELEHGMAAFLGREAAVVATTGFQTNLALAALLDRGDVVIGDAANHASLHDAARLGLAAHRRYRHADMAHLERLLAAAGPAVGKLVVTDGLFSMEGDLCRLPEITAIARRHGARVVVDGAHDIGLLGAGGRGVAEHFGLLAEVDLFTGTFSKCFGSTGGVLAGPAHVVEYLKYHARSLLFAAALPPAAAGAALAALGIVRSEPERRARVLAHTARLHDGLRALGYDTGTARTPVIPVRVGESVRCALLWQRLFDAGVFTNAVVPPAVPEGAALIRVTPQAVHTDAHIDTILTAFAGAAPAA
ncbi:pyridoxal phosphate-dependent aminotransferase family protein [Streptomyces sp. RFCAC02]|uniref:aminotransferase class I/II-fold pyridoxal phosphate-dependent enzyme n=1 Tax=Streptomyces sp. RFCAC02 TaxID=2499143 RepID=UPI001F0EF4A3|nr:pyridoxal phosphate-dependent aminotransferase family protein [Streptomyces sp. RFCAC02]